MLGDDAIYFMLLVIIFEKLVLEVFMLEIFSDTLSSIVDSLPKGGENEGSKNIRRIWVNSTSSDNLSGAFLNLKN